jgi:SAM-dependent methyltransferase
MQSLQSIHKKVVMSRRIDTLAKHIARLLPIAESETGELTGLDVGCGSGEIAAMVERLMPQVTIEGVDVFVRGVTHIPISEYDGETLPFDDNSFDFVTLIDVLHHTDAPDRVLAECVRVARRAVIVKDHYRNNQFDDLRLRFMDWVGNRSHGVRLPYNYLSRRQWRNLYGDLGLFSDTTLEALKLYPVPFRWVFDGQLHFVTRLRCLEGLRDTLEDRGAIAPRDVTPDRQGLTREQTQIASDDRDVREPQPQDDRLDDHD